MQRSQDLVLQKGIEAHRAGKVREADRLYTSILRQNPQHPDANHNIGVLAVEVGKMEQALPFFKTALKNKPDTDQYWLSYIDTLIKLNRVIDAKIALEQARIFCAVGNGFHALSRRIVDIQATPQLSVSPQDPSLSDLKRLTTLFANREYQQILIHAITLLEEFPNSHQLYNIIGAVKLSLGEPDNAIRAYNKALAINPEYVNSYNNLGLALQRKGYFDEALEAYGKALSLKPNFVAAYGNSVELLKIYRPKNASVLEERLAERQISITCEKLINASSNKQIMVHLSEALNHVDEDGFGYKSPLSQIYKRNCVDLNCTRHMSIFNKEGIIPKFCFECFKVQVEVTTVVELVKLTSIFYKFDYEEDLTKKTMVELRPNVNGYYKGLIYCRGLEQARKVKFLLDGKLMEVFKIKDMSKIKRGCSEYSLAFPEYGQLRDKSDEMMRFPVAWKVLEMQFDEIEYTNFSGATFASYPEYSLSDFYVIQKWIDYAKGIEDQSVKRFANRPIIFQDIYELARARTKYEEALRPQN